MRRAAVELCERAPPTLAGHALHLGGVGALAQHEAGGTVTFVVELQPQRHVRRADVGVVPLLLADEQLVLDDLDERAVDGEVIDGSSSLPS